MEKIFILNGLGNLSSKQSSTFINNVFKLTAINRKNFTTAENHGEIKIEYKGKEPFYPIKELPTFEKGLFTVFEYTQEGVKVDEEGAFQRLPQVPYEIKEHALKGFVYSFFLTFLGRFSAGLKLTPLSIWNIKLFPHFVFGVVSYHVLRPLWYMYNSVTKIQLTQDGEKVILEFKNGLKKPIEVDIWRLNKKKPENFLQECYTEPFLYPIEIDFTDITGKYSFQSKRTVYLYGDSHKCIKHGEILRAILNNQTIKLK